MALIDEVPIVITNTLPEHVSARQITSALAAALWDAIEDRENERVYMGPAQGFVRVKYLHDAFAYLIGPRRPE